MKTHGINILDDELNIAPKLKKGINSNEGIDIVRVTGLISEDFERYFKEYTNWISIDNMKKFDGLSIDFFIFDDEAIDQSIENVKKAVEVFKNHCSIILFLKQIPKTSIDINLLEKFNKVYICGDINIEDTIFEKIKNKVEIISFFIDMKKYTPQNRTISSGKLAIIVNNFSVEQILFKEMFKEFEYWSAREDLQIICFNDKSLSFFADNPDLACRITEIIEDINEVNSNLDASILLNFTDKRLSNYEIFKRMATGQLAINNIYIKNKKYYFLNHLNNDEEKLEAFISGLRKHFSFEKINVKSIRKISQINSPLAHIREIVSGISNKRLKSRGVSIIVCTNKPMFIDNVIENFKRQTYKDKELIIVLHSNDIRINDVKNRIKDSNIRIYHRRPNSISFGYSLNFGICHSGKEFIAKFDDDDYYDADYLSDLMNAFCYTDAQVVGKLTFHTYLHASEQFVTRKPGNEYIFTSFLPGATFLIKREVFYKNMFRNVPSDIDGKFCLDCINNKIKLYSIDSFNLLINRLADKNTHTWKASDQSIIRQSLPAFNSIDDCLVSSTAYLIANSVKTSYEEAMKQISV